MTQAHKTALTRPTVPNRRLLPVFESALIDCWVTDRPAGLQALITSVRHALPDDDSKKANRASVTAAVYDTCRALERADVYRPQSAKNGLRVSFDEQAGNAVHWLNLSCIPVREASVADIVRPYLECTDAVSDAQRSRFRTAMRLILGLPDQRGDSAILAAAARLSIGEAVALPNRAMDKALAAGQSPQSAKNLRTAIRAAMRFAAERRACPIVFRETPVPADAWVNAMNTHFPLAERGPTPQTILSLRKGLKVLAMAADDALEHGHLKHRVTPDSLTRQDGAQIITYIRTRLGKEYDARAVRAVLNKLTAFGFGKLNDVSPFVAFEVDTPLGKRSSLYLRGQDGKAGSSNWAKMLDVVDSAALPMETIELLRWYGEWVTLSPEAFLEQDCPWPPVLNRHLLSRSSLDNRSNDMRAWIGCAIQICGIEPASLTPSRLFGEYFDRIGKALTGWWRARQAVLRSEGRRFGAATKGSLHHIIVSAGIVAYAGYVRERYRRGLAAEVGGTHDEGRIDLLAELTADKTTKEARLLAGYGSSLGLAATVKRLVSAKGKRGRKSAKDEAGVYQPEFKDIRRIVQHTPPAWWIQLLDSMHERIRTAVRGGRDTGREFHLLVQHAWELGLFISTGFRGEEACRLELGVHLKTGESRISLAATERKNVKRQTVDLQARYVPADIHELYLTGALPWLRSGQFEEIALRHDARQTRGERAARVQPLRNDWCARATATRARTRNHNFLIVDTNGSAPGELQTESLRMAGLDMRASDDADRAFKEAVGRHGIRWKAAMMKRAVEAGLRLPDELDFSFGRHCIRGAFGYAIYHTVGEVAAANYLGDSIETVRLAYTAIEGINTDVSVVAGFVVPNRGIQLHDTTNLPSGDATVTSAASEGSGVAAYLAKEAELRSDLRAGILTRERYDALDAHCRQLYLGTHDVRAAS